MPDAFRTQSLNCVHDPMPLGVRDKSWQLVISGTEIAADKESTVGSLWILEVDSFRVADIVGPRAHCRTITLRPGGPAEERAAIATAVEVRFALRASAANKRSGKSARA